MQYQTFKNLEYKIFESKRIVLLEKGYEQSEIDLIESVLEQRAKTNQ